MQANWRDNPWFPAELEAERTLDKANFPDEYDHVWEGAYNEGLQGRRYASLLLDAQNGAASVVAADPLMQIRCYWDISGTGAKTDATAIWAVQFGGAEIRVLNCYEAQRSADGRTRHWLKARLRANCKLPHDADNTKKLNARKTNPRAERRRFRPSCCKTPAKAPRDDHNKWDVVCLRCGSTRTQQRAGRDALAAYHEKRDEERT